MRDESWPKSAKMRSCESEGLWRESINRPVSRVTLTRQAGHRSPVVSSVASEADVHWAGWLDGWSPVGTVPIGDQRGSNPVAKAV